MKLLTLFKLTAVLAVASAGLWASGGSNAQVAAHEESSNPADVEYSYAAQPGDSYTKMARKSVQTYGLKSKINLSPAAIIFAETNLTKAANSPALDEGQKVEIKESAIHDWVDKAQDLTDSQEAAWNYYVQFVNFNTDSVGEPR